MSAFSFSDMSQSYSSSSSFSPNLDLGVSPSTFLVQPPSPEIEKFSPSVTTKLETRGDRERERVPTSAPRPRPKPISPVSYKTRMSYLRKLNLVAFHEHSQEMYATEEHLEPTSFFSSSRRRSTSPTTTINVSSAPIAIPRSRQWLKLTQGAQFITPSSSEEEQDESSEDDQDPSTLAIDPNHDHDLEEDMFVLEM